MRLLRRNIIAHPHNKNTNMKIERDILYISIEKNNFEYKHSHLMPNASYVNKHD